MMQWAHRTANTDEIVHVVGDVSSEAREHVLDLTSLLSSWGYPVSVVGDVDQDFARDLAHANVPATAISLPAGRLLPEELVAPRMLARLLTGRSVSLIHAHGLRAGLLSLLARSRRFSPPVVCTPNFLPHVVVNGAGGALRTRAYRYALQRCDAIIAASEVQRTQIRDFHPPADQRAVVVPYGIDARRYHDPLTVGRRRQLLGVTPTAAVVGCVADQAAPESIELFMDAAADLCSRLPNLEFVVIGADPEYGPFHDMAHERGLLGATVFVRPQRHPTRLLTPLNVLAVLQPGWPGGYLALHALVRGLGVIALPCGETEEMLLGSPAVTIAAEAQPKALADAVLSRLTSDAARVKSVAGEEAPIEVSQFLVSRQSWDLDRSWQPPRDPTDGTSGPLAADAAARFGITQMARQTVAVYHDLLDRSARAAPD